MRQAEIIKKIEYLEATAQTMLTTCYELRKELGAKPVASSSTLRGKDLAVIVDIVNRRKANRVKTK